MSTIRRSIEYYLNTSKLSESARDNFVLLIDKLGDLAETELEDVNPAIIRLWLNELDMKESSKYLYYTNLKSALNRFVRDHKYKIDFSDLVGLCKAPKVNPDEIKMLDFDQVKEIMALEIENKIVRHYRDIFILMVFTGMSVRDMSKFDKSWLSPGAEGSKFKFWLKYSRTKRGAFCIVPLLDVAVEIIDRWEWPIKDAGVRSIKHYCIVLSKLTGYHLNPHLARKTCGRLFLEWGFSLESVSKLLGHSSITTTARYYSVVTAAKIELEAGRIPEVILNIR